MKKAINLRDVFALRDLKGSPLFAAGGKLTPEGMEAYLSAQNGEKSWLMPYEIVSQTPEDEKQSAEMQALMRKGFQEISEDEYLWLLKATTCPDDVLREPPCDIKVFKTSRTVKYFLCYSPPPNCSDAAVKLAGYVGRYRANDTSMPEGTRTTAFFGTGGGEKRHFCHNGKIWLGD